MTVSRTIFHSAQTYLQKLTRSNGLNPGEHSAVGDYLEDVNDSVDRVKNSISELKNADRVKGQEFVMLMSNVKTWVSSALTNEDTCMDGSSGQARDGPVKKLVRALITDVGHVTSNALAIINHFVEKHS
uniref:21 kDa protein-like n=1 Tax=Erigeron canadensis TaxID=72917 RepID=UPI001CB8DEC0|nr:21 kDa protein-like [Erigeron canadensis]